MTEIDFGSVNAVSDLLKEVEAHLAWRASVGKKIQETTFGMYSAANTRLVQHLRAGKDFQSVTIRRVRKFIKEDRREIERRTRGRR
jgi:hypothetical protein